VHPVSQAQTIWRLLDPLRCSVRALSLAFERESGLRSPPKKAD